MSSSRFRFSLWALAAFVLVAQQADYKAKEEKLPGDPVTQPIAYRHRTHVALGLKCTNCHTMPGEGAVATYPEESTCMGCHATIKKESAEIQKLAAFAAKKERVPWARVYRLPDIVWFNHALHVKTAKAECSVCHGEVEKRDVLFQEKSISMPGCMACHAKHEAPNGCDVCHSSQ